MLEGDLQTTSTSLESELSKGADMERDLAALRGCLQQVMEEKPHPGQEEEEEEEEGGGEGVDGEGREEARVVREAQLRKIEAMLDTTKVSFGGREGGREGGGASSEMGGNLSDMWDCCVTLYVCM